MTTVSYREAIREALAAELERDPQVVLFGEDVSHGGVFNVTPGLIDRFGPERIIDTPISELALAGAAFGAAAAGTLRPVVEIMFADFLGLASTRSSISPRSTGTCRTSRRAFRSSCAPPWAAARGSEPATRRPRPAGCSASPGLKLVAPATVADAMALTRDAIRDDNPVVVFEHKLLYGRKGELDDEASRLGIGRAAVRRGGRDVTLVAALAAVETCLAAAEELKAAGIDARSSTCAACGRSTAARSPSRSRARAISSWPRRGRLGRVRGGGCRGRDGALRARARPASHDAHLPLPFSPPLESAALPSAARIAAAATALVEGRPPLVGSSA